MDTEQTSARAESIRRFDRLGELPTNHLEKICEQAEWLSAKKKSLIIDLGNEEHTTIFLLQGNVLLKAADGGEKIIRHSDKAASLPISRLRPSQYRVSALTNVSYLKIDNTLLEGLYQSDDEPSTLLSTQYEVSISTGEESDSHARLLTYIYEDLNNDKLKILSWYPVIRQVAEQTLAEKKNIRRLAQYSMLDPVLSLKIIKARCADNKSVAELAIKDAIAAIGIDALHKLTFLNLFSESAHTTGDQCKDAFSAAWERSITTAKVAKLLALNKHHHNPDYIALSALLHNIGELILISYAYALPAPMQQEELEDCIHLYTTEVGKVVLSHWQLPRKLIRMVTESDRWKRNSGTQPDDVDFVLLARAYTMLTRKDGAHAPKISDIPAYRKMSLNVVGNELHNKLKTLAADSVDETLSFLHATRI